MNAPRPLPRDVDEAAIEWFVRLRDQAATAADRDGHAAWLAADPSHRQAWREVEALWSGLDQVGPSPALPTVRRRPTLRAAALAASLLLAVAAGWSVAPAGLFADERSRVGERRALRLADGSEVELGSATALSVQFTAGERRVVLHRGEGYFAVARDADRPFVVEAAGARVTVLSTEFDVKVADGVRVAVAEGIVTMSAGAAAPVRLTAGRGARYGDGRLSDAVPVDLAEVTAWREGRLVFHGRPLGAVVRDLERHRWGRILVLDAAIAGLPVTGTFQAARGDAALATIAATLPVRIVWVTDLLTLILPAG